MRLIWLLFLFLVFIKFLRLLLVGNEVVIFLFLFLLMDLKKEFVLEVMEFILFINFVGVFMFYLISFCIKIIRKKYKLFDSGDFYG